MTTTGDFMMQRLHEWGVRRIYGYSGDGIGDLMGALDRASDRIDFVQVRHEEMAAFMATGHAKFTDEVGVCLATSGPGAIHLLNGLYDAQMDHVPVVAIVGQAATTAIGGSYQQEVDLQTLFKDVAHEFCVTVASPEAMRHAIDRAFRTAAALRCVTAIIVPKDIPGRPAVPHPPAKHEMLRSGVGYRASRVLPHDADLRDAAAILNAGRRIAVLVGAGARGAEAEVLAIAERLGAGVAKALLGKAVVGDETPFVTGTLGLLGTGTSSYLMRHCDTLLMIGTTFPYSEFLPRDGQARCVQIDIDARNLSLRYPADVPLAGDAGETLRALAPLLERASDRTWQERIIEERRSWEAQERARALTDAHPLNPERVLYELSDVIPDGCILASDAGSNTNWTARYVHLRHGMKYALSGSLATMGAAVPYGIAAKFAYPERLAIAVTGDGAMQMNGNAELITLARYYRTWSDPRMIVCVLNNRDLNQVTWEQRIESGDPKFAAAQDLPDFSYARYAESLGLRGVRVERGEDVAAAWREALAADRPVVLEAVTDPNVATLPPFITVDQAAHFASAFARGDVDAVPAIVASVKGIAAGLLHGKD